MWVGHPKFFVIDNKDKNFQRKLERAIETVQNIVGVPTAASFYKKYLLKREVRNMAGGLALPPHVKSEELIIEETFMRKKDGELENKIVKRGKNQTYSYTQEIRYLKNGQRIEKKRQMSAKEYIDMLEFKEAGK